MYNYRVLLDTCVLYNMPACDLLIRLSLHDHCQLKWTERSRESAITHILEKNTHLSRDRVANRLVKMEEAVNDWEASELKTAMSLDFRGIPVNDRYIVSAAMHSQCDAILTFNKKDFPEEIVAPYGLEILDPDCFIIHQCDLFKSSREKVVDIVSCILFSLRDPNYTVDIYVQKLEAAQLKETANFVSNSKPMIEKGLQELYDRIPKEKKVIPIDAWQRKKS